MTERTILDMALEALRPFAEIADNYEQARLSTAEAYRDEEPPPLLDSHRVCVALGDLRRAAAAVEAIEKMKGDAAPPPPPGDMVRVPRELLKCALEFVSGYSPYKSHGAEANEWLRTIKQIETLLAASPLPTQEGWQSMESAPKDGTAILLHVPNSDPPVVVGEWRRGAWEVGHSDTSIGRMNAILSRDNQPAHWRPLPAPPESALPTGERKE